MATNELIVSIWRDALELEGLPRDAVALVSDPSYETATAFMQMKMCIRDRSRSDP